MRQVTGCVVFEEVVSNQKFPGESIEVGWSRFRTGVRREESLLCFENSWIRGVAAARSESAQQSICGGSSRMQWLRHRAETRFQPGRLCPS
jgi:hypothetical protein